MSASSRNIAVGLTVIVGLVLLGALALVFTGRPMWSQSGYDLRVVLDDAAGLRDGSAVQLNGMDIGKVISVDFRDGDAAKGLIALARIDAGRRIPATAQAEATPPPMGMGSSVLRLSSPLAPQGAEGKFLPIDNSALLVGRSGGLMRQMETLAEGIGQLMLALNTGAGPDGQTLPPDSPVALLTASLKKVNLTLDATLTLIGDPDNQQNVNITLANARELSTQALATMDDVKTLIASGRDLMTSGQGLITSGQGLITQAGETMTEITHATTKASASVDRLTQNLIDNTEQLSRTLTTLNAALIKLEQGEGTAGKLLNDPRLYGNLVDIAEQMNSVMKDLQLLVQEWKDRGVGIRLK
ncbi:MAG: MlaD family protein [Phycisphaerae bacterium]|nr:MlaD family protein [Phycisphaerae bacterium]